MFEVRFMHSNAGAEFTRSFRAKSKRAAGVVAFEWYSRAYGMSGAFHMIDFAGIKKSA